MSQPFSTGLTNCRRVAAHATCVSSCRRLGNISCSRCSSCGVRRCASLHHVYFEPAEGTLDWEIGDKLLQLQQQVPRVRYVTSVCTTAVNVTAISSLTFAQICSSA